LGGDSQTGRGTSLGEGLENFLASPWLGTAIVLLGVVTGLLGSLYADELKAMLFSVAPLSARTGAWLFIVAVAVTALAVFSRQRVIDRKRELVQNRFDAAASHIPELIRTLPEPAFQSELGIVFEKTATMVPNLTSLQTRAEGVTVILQGFAALAGKFDGGRLDDRFATNLMVYLEGVAKEPWLPLLRFFDRDPKTLAGVLALPAEFAALAAGPDPKVPEFALPVPQDLGQSREEPGGQGWRVLPGAPFALARNTFEHYRRTSLLEAWCADYGDFNHREKSELKKHFADHAAEIGGFFCIPIRRPSTAYVSDRASTALGVLNVHWNRCDRLRDPHSAQLFASATYPLQVLLAQVLVDLLAERPPLPSQRLSVAPAKPQQS
jgi:hypothetical protein